MARTLNDQLRLATQRGTRFAPHLAIMASVAMFASRVACAQYTFIKVADSSGSLGTNFGWPDINDDGTVAFWNILDDGTNTVIYTGNGGALSLQASTLDTFSKLEFAPTINNAGAVAFWAEKPPASARGIYKSLNGVITTVADAPGSGFYDFDYLPSINDNGDVAFYGQFDTCCNSAIATGADVIYDLSGPFFSLGPASINNSGSVAFNGGFDSGGGGIFTGVGGGYTTIASTATFSLFTHPTMNDSGVVAFGATMIGGVKGVFSGSGGPLTTIATTTGPYGGFSAGGVGINNHGDVAFYANLDTGGKGIFTGPDPAVDAVIKVGDSLFGSIVYSVNFVHGMNNHGDLAFTYVLQNAGGGAGIAGVAIAKAPIVALPEDIDGDGDVDAADLALLLGSWGTNSRAADLNGDGTVNAADLAMLLGGWTG